MTAPLTTEEMERLKALYAKATPGPWTLYAEMAGHIISVENGPRRPKWPAIATCAPSQGDNAVLIVRMHEALPSLLAELTRLREERERMREALDLAEYDLSVAASYANESGISVGLRVHARACADTLAKMHALAEARAKEQG